MHITSDLASALQAQSKQCTCVLFDLGSSEQMHLNHASPAAGSIPSCMSSCCTCRCMSHLMLDLELQGRLNIFNQSLVLAGAPFSYVGASGLTKDSTVTKQSTCNLRTATG